MTKFCNKCNSPIEEGYYFCTECGSNNIRDDEEKPQTTDEEQIQETIQETDNEIPEIDTNIVNDFAEKSIEHLKQATVTAISNSKENDDKDETEPINKGINDLTNSKEINIPTDFDLQEKEGENGESEDETQKNHDNTITKPRRVNHYLQKKQMIQKRRKKRMFRIGIAIGGILILGLIILLALGYEKRIQNPFSKQEPWPNKTSDTTDFTKIFTPENSFRVGSATTGYVSIPNTWAQVTQPEGNNIQQFTDGEKWVVTLMTVETTQYSAVAYANSVYNSIKKGGGKNIKTGKTTLVGYNALTITATYPEINKYLTTWCFESNNGQTHYLAIEGPEPSGDNYNIIYSFREDQ